MRKVDNWENCYPSKWKGLIVEGAIAHPAKFSSKLISRIYQHMMLEGWLKPGDKVIDPFGGVALGAMDAMRLGLIWRGIELEANFAKLGNLNIALWNSKFSRMPRWCCDAILINGDSRDMVRLLGEAAGCVSSPPYAESMGNAEQGGIDWGKQQDRDTEHPHGYNGAGYSQAAVSSPPYADIAQQGGTEGLKEHGTGLTQGQAAFGEYSDVAGIVSSPPCADGCAHTGGDSPTSQDHIEGGTIHLPGIQGVLSSPPYNEARIGSESGQEQCGRGDQYGSTPGQLGAMKSGGFQAALASPPFRQASGGTNVTQTEGVLADPALHKRHAAGNASANAYGKTEGQLANMGEGDFAAATISSPPFMNALTGGGIAVDGYGDGDMVGDRSYTPKMQGTKEGNLANMPAGDFDAAVTSPPYLPKDDRKVPWGATEGKTLADEDEARGYKRDNSFRGTYSLDPANLGNPTGADQSDFWAAARTIVEQVFFVLEPGGHAAWVVKDFVKDKARVQFCDQWRMLCEAVGFITVHEHHALIVRDQGSSQTLEGGEISHKKASKSFFRRLSEKKTAQKAYWANLSKHDQVEFLMSTHNDIWDAYYRLTDEQKAEKTKNGKLKHPQPDDRMTTNRAIVVAWDKSCQKEEDWNADTRIDYEVVLCMEKPI